MKWPIVELNEESIWCFNVLAFLWRKHLITSCEIGLGIKFLSIKVSYHNIIGSYNLFTYSVWCVLV